MSAVSNNVMPRSSARWITLREVSRSVRWPKLLQPSPTADTRRPEPPRLRISMGDPVRRKQEPIVTGVRRTGKRLPALLPCSQRRPRGKKMRPLSDAATDGDRLGRLICDGGLIRRRRNLMAKCYARVTGRVIHRAPATWSEDLAIDDEAGTFRDPVVQALRREIGLMRLPIDARRSRELGALVDAMDQRRGDTLAARGLKREQILQIAGWLDRGGAAMKQIVRQPEQAAVALGNQRMHRLVRIEEALPR